MIPDPLMGGAERLEVLGLEKSLCKVELGFGVERVASNYYFFEEAASYSEGYLEINDPVGSILRDEHSARFYFRVRARPSRDYQDCFLVLQIFTQDGRELLLPYELEDMKAGKAQSISIQPQLAFDDLNRGVYYYHFFSGGEEIYYAPTQLRLGKKHHRPLPINDSGDRDPELKTMPESKLPEQVLGFVSGEEALVAIGVNDSGYSVDHLVLSAGNPMVGKIAMNLVKNARFSPGAENGFFVRKDMLVRVSFDSQGDYRLLAE